MTTQVTPLAEGFPPAGQADWLSLVAKTLKGAGPESLTGRTADDLAILPLYTGADGARPAVFKPAPRAGEASWDVRAAIAAADPATGNRDALDALAGGAASLLLKVDTGAGGARLSSEADLARLLDGVMTDLAPVALDAGFAGPMVAAWLDGVAKASPAAPLALHFDPLSAFAESGASPGPIEAHTAGAAKSARALAETYPRASLFLASGAAVHEAGGSAAWELAFAAAAVVTYAKALAGAGLGVNEAFGRITLGISVDAQPLAAIAKLRAARVLWARLAGACGADVPARIEARSSRRMLTRADRWTNLIRLTSAGFGAAVGGADAIVLGAFTDPIGAPDAFALRMARNTQLVLMEEAHLGRVADPAAGSWAVEAQTSDLARLAWSLFQAIESVGGLTAALKDGVFATAVARGREALETAIGDRTMRIIGVTDFVAADETGAAGAGASEASSTNSHPDPRLPGPDDACPPLAPVRLEEMAS